MSSYIVNNFKSVRGLSPLPIIIQEIADLAGLEAALKVAFKFGGRMFHFPNRGTTLSEDHPLVVAIGIDAARKIGLHFSDRVELPMAPFTHSSLSFFKYAKHRRFGDNNTIASRRVGTNFRNGRRWNGLIESGAITNNDFIAFGKAIGDEW